ncbi:hypothetical protein C8Q80DRAFT_1119340 [Daedaleopsis nitida]|nr:hypothetical protein C8Q80DRAFT_1119340 [Daedaleopsis nitida]
MRMSSNCGPTVKRQSARMCRPLDRQQPRRALHCVAAGQISIDPKFSSTDTNYVAHNNLEQGVGGRSRNVSNRLSKLREVASSHWPSLTGTGFSMFTYYVYGIDDSSTPELYGSYYYQTICGVATLVFLCYEHIITFDKEVEYFWRRHLNGGSVFFLFNRYSQMLARVVDISGNASMSAELSSSSSAWFPLPWNAETHLSAVTIAGRTSLISADLIVVIVTWYATYRMGVLRRTIHCCTLLLLNALHLLFALHAIDQSSVDPVCYVTLFTKPATTVIISRFLIHVQEVNKHAVLGEMPVHITIDTMQFAKNTGSSLESPSSAASALLELESIQATGPI